MNTYTQKISPNQAKEIKQILDTENAIFDTVQYSVWRAKTSSFQAIYYTSGKLLVQGKDIENFVTRIDNVLGIKLEDSDNYAPECTASPHIGTDESGKGDFFGPLIIASVLVNDGNKQKFIDLGIKDSKKLTDAKILELAGKIKANSVHSTVVITPVKYNELYDKFKNLNKLLAWGHARAIENILEKTPCEYALADKFGDESLIQNALMKNGRKIKLEQMVRAEADIAVAAASVLARAEFVKRVKEMEVKYENTFPKGVSDKVISSAQSYIKKYGYDRLNEVAKMHFKTAKELK